MNVETRILHACCKLRALSFLFGEAGAINAMGEDELSGIHYILDDIHADLKPLRTAPAQIGQWEPDDSENGGTR